jgi:hypothetical protein
MGRHLPQDDKLRRRLDQARSPRDRAEHALRLALYLVYKGDPGGVVHSAGESRLDVAALCGMVVENLLDAADDQRRARRGDPDRESARLLRNWAEAGCPAPPGQWTTGSVSAQWLRDWAHALHPDAASEIAGLRNDLRAFGLAVRDVMTEAQLDAPVPSLLGRTARSLLEGLSADFLTKTPEEWRGSSE